MAKLTLKVWTPVAAQARHVTEHVDLVEGSGRVTVVVDVYDADAKSITLHRAVVYTDTPADAHAKTVDEARWKSLWEDKFNLHKSAERESLQYIADVSQSNLQADTKCHLIQLLRAKHTTKHNEDNSDVK